MIGASTWLDGEFTSSGAPGVRTRRAVRTRAPASVALIGLMLLAAGGAAEARPAHCTTTDDGSYPCDFKVTDKDGSFEVTAPGKPVYMLVIEAPGTASAFVNLGNRNISLAGSYVRSKSDPACWASDATNARICVR